MYTPAANRESDLPTLRQFVRENPLCALVSGTAAGLAATHIPVVLHATGAGFGTLRGHVARANAHWRAWNGDEALAIFTGDQHYISASYYPGKHTHGQEVPTWNYIAVHAYGPLRAIHDTAWLLEHLRTLTDQSEADAALAVPWSIADAPPGFIEKVAGGIVGFEMEVTRVEGRWKLSQNRSDADRAAVMAELERRGTPESERMRSLIAGRRTGGREPGA